jgi:hypothetical protein
LRTSGFSLGPHITVLAHPHPKVRHQLSIAAELEIDLVDGRKTFGEYFGLRTSSARKFYDSSLESLILSYVVGTVTRGLVCSSANTPSAEADSVCGRCANHRHSKPHKTCSQVYRNGKLMNDGICNNCLFNGSSALCSFRRELPNLPHFSFSFVQNAC